MEDKDRVDLYKFIGSKIKQKRKELKISQEKLGEMIGVDYHLIQRYEKGINKIPFDKLIEISKYLNTQLEYFYIKKYASPQLIFSNPELEKEIMMLKEIYNYNDENLIYIAKTNIELAYGLLKKERRVRKNAGGIKKKMA
ncbi:MAG: helix-turn-helix transcriptional regulator [Deltaproteobacteria bacterium]|jgi:transcriptional regulator with XRE-family HTH domain|nr:helix-turn-helix transcriptional regulator [Deltaproteobacteria bacterium]